MRHRVIIGVGLALAMLVVLASPAGATSSETRSASAFWDGDDAKNTNVSVQATEAKGNQPGNLFLFVTQSYCDTSTDERVFRNFSADQPLTKKQFAVHPQLKWAALGLKTTVNGTEQRIPDCSATTGGGTFTNLGPSPVQIAIGWDGFGPIYQVQPGIQGRAAVADGYIKGPVLNTGRLGPSDNAEMRRSNL
jgi:hypothetical protein